MQKTLSLLFIFFFQLVFAQHLSHHLKGQFTAKSSPSFYTSLYFDGKGKVKINDYEEEFIFYEKNDSIFIIVDKTPFSFVKKSKGNLIGTSDWVKDVVFRSETKSFEYGEMPKDEIEKLKLLDQYFTLNYKNAFEILLGNSSQEWEKLIDNIQLENKKLCEQEFELACVQEFVYRLTKVSGGFDRFMNIAPEEVKPDDGLIPLGNKIIQLGNPDGYGLLATYFFVLGDKINYQFYMDKGKERGCKICLEIEMNQLINTIETENEN